MLNKQFPDASKTPPPKFLTGGWETFYQGQHDAANATGQVVTLAIYSLNKVRKVAGFLLGYKKLNNSL